MDDIKRKKAFLWDPHRSQMFALGLGGALRLYGWDDSVRSRSLLHPDSLTITDQTLIRDERTDFLTSPLAVGLLL